jgi:hypothetical protein
MNAGHDHEPHSKQEKDRHARRKPLGGDRGVSIGHGIRTFTGTLDRLIAAGLTVKVAVVGKNAKRKAI